jgi:hypothetical protein
LGLLFVPTQMLDMASTTQQRLHKARPIFRDRRKFGGARARAVFSRLLSDQGWTRGLDCEAGASRG